MVKKRTVKLGKITAKFKKANDVTCECTKDVTNRIGENCQCFVTPSSDEMPTIIKTDTAKLLKVDKLQV